MKRSAFTLLELTVALAIGAMLAATAVFSLRGPYRDVPNSRRQWNSWSCSINRSVAMPAALGGSAELTIDLTTGTLTADEPQRGQPTRRLVLSPGLRIDRVELTAKRVSQGKAAVPIFGQGHSQSYAVRLRGLTKQASGYCSLASRDNQ